MTEFAPVVVKGIADQVVELPIGDGPATGYSWLLDLPAGVVRIGDGPAKHVDAERGLGASASGAIRVVASKGSYRISARLVRPWEPENPAAAMVIDLIIE
ncbi:MAG: hypothetical protein WCG19_03855 [Chlorobiaceae bacterium]